MVAACPSQEELQFCLAAAQQPRPSSSSAQRHPVGVLPGGGPAPWTTRQARANADKLKTTRYGALTSTRLASTRPGRADAARLT